jgi:HD superfamily phosphohydrolase
MQEVERILRHLERDFSEPIRDPLWKHIYLSPGLMSVAASAPFRKLAGIRQLGLAHLVYPGATHTRFLHSLGVLHLARRIIQGLVGKEEAPLLSLEGVKAFLAAALLHDIGHFPFTHSFKELPLKSHEALTAELIMEEPLCGIISSEVGTLPWMAAAIVDESLDDGGSCEIAFFRRLLSGVLDPDKLDYLNRDAYFCGVPYGVQDTDFVIDRLRPHAQRGIALDASGLPAVENILFSKYLMYRTVYWHRTVRIATAMIKKAVFLALSEGVLLPADLYGLDDEAFFRLAARRAQERGFAALTLVRKAASRELFKTVAELRGGEAPFAALASLGRRAEAEAHLARELGRAAGLQLAPEDVIIDIPEPLNLEADIPVLKKDGSTEHYSLLDSVFTSTGAENFSRPLRVLRVALPPAAAFALRGRGAFAAEALAAAAGGRHT